MTTAQQIIDQVAKESKPDKSLENRIIELVSKINNELKTSKIKAKCVLGGSVAKGTFIKGEHDIDLFVKFDYSYKEKDISSILFKVLLKISKKTEIVHGSRDYYHIKDSNFVYEIVPVLDVKDPKKAVNVTDMSPMHADWVKKSSSKIKGEIRAAKLFCKSQRVYGAESYIKGFSGHVLDILVIRYKGFLNLLKAALLWKKTKEFKKTGKIVVDFYNKHKGKALSEINHSKLQSPLIVVDPVLSARNAAAALSNEKFDIFIESAEKFIKKLSYEFFRQKNIDKDYFKTIAEKNSSKLILLEAETLDNKQDVAGAKALKAFEYLKDQLTENDFILKKYSDWVFYPEKSKALFAIFTEKKPIEKTKLHVGPPINQKKNAALFRKKYKKVIITKNRLYTRINRKFTDADKFISFLIKRDYLKDKVVKIKPLNLK